MTPEVPTLAVSATPPRPPDPSPAGRLNSRRNALKHGLTAKVLTADEHVEAVRRRREEWRPLYEIRTAQDEWVFDQLVAASVRADACRAQEPALRAHLAKRAALLWD